MIRPGAGEFTVGELVETPGLGLTLVVPGALGAAVRGAHAIELERPGAWLEPGWIMLTTGMGLRGRGERDPAHHRLVEELVEHEVPALFFGTGVHVDAVPTGLVEACEELGMTLVSVAADVPFLAIERAVNHAVQSTTTAQLHQRLRLQNDLIETLARDQPIQALIARMGALINGTAVLYEESGTVVASTGQGPAMLVWGELRGAGREPARFVVGRWHVVARPILLRGVVYWLALGSKRPEVLDDLAEPLLDATEQLLGAIRGVRTLSAAQTMTESTQILRTLRADLSPEAANRVWDRLRGFRFQRDNAIRAFVAIPIASLPPGEGLVGSLADETVNAAHAGGLPLLLDSRPDGLSGLVAEAPALEGWANRLAEHHHVGLSEPFADLHLVRSRFRDAQRALRVTTRRQSYPTRSGEPARVERGSVLMFEDADVITWLLSSRSESALAAKVEQQLGALIERPELVETLVVHLSVGMDITATARALFLHRNSVRYRLRRIEELIEAPLSSPAVVANLYVAFHDRVLGEQDLTAREETPPAR